MDVHGPFTEHSHQYKLLQSTLIDIEAAVEGGCYEDLMRMHAYLKVRIQATAF